MKKIFMAALLGIFFYACGKGKTAIQIAEEICECSKKANAIPTSDPNRAQAQADCLKQQQEGWDKVKDDPEKADQFNTVLGKCASEQIKKSFGQ